MSTLEFYVRSDLVPDGYTECGSPKEKTEFYIVGEFEDGQRIRLTTSSIVNREHTDDECIQYLERIIAKIEKKLSFGGKLTPEHWENIDPRYGSRAYIVLDNSGYFYRREKLEDSYRN